MEELDFFLLGKYFFPILFFIGGFLVCLGWQLRRRDKYYDNVIGRYIKLHQTLINDLKKINEELRREVK